MALIPINNQPVRMEPFPEETFACAHDEYCTHYTNSIVGDLIMVQMKQTPCGDNLVADGTFTIDNYLPYWAFTYGYWVINDNGTDVAGSATKIPGSAGTLTQAILPASTVIGDYFTITYTVTGMTDGVLTVLLGGNTSRVVTENGTYTDYVYMTVLSNLLLSFSADATFDGSVSNISGYQLIYNFTGAAKLVDLDDTIIGNMLVDILDDRVTFYYPLSGLAEGCYRVVVIDDCNDYFTIVAGTELINNPLITDPGSPEWGTYEVNASSTLTGGKIVQTTGAGANNITWIGNNDLADLIPLTGTYILQIRVITGAMADINMSLDIWSWDGVSFASGIDLIGSIPSLSANTTHLIQFVHSFDPASDGINFKFNNTYTLAGHDNEFLSINIKYIPVDTGVDEFGYRSNCLKVVADVGNMVKVIGSPVALADIGDDDIYSMDFLFSDVFTHLEMLLDLSFTNPHRPVNQNTYLYSSGSKDKTHAYLDKAWDLVFHAVDENAHDVISTMMQMEYTYINGNRYICEDKEYTADWAKGEAGLAESVVEVSRVGKVIFK